MLTTDLRWQSLEIAELRNGLILTADNGEKRWHFPSAVALIFPNIYPLSMSQLSPNSADGLKKLAMRLKLWLGPCLCLVTSRPKIIPWFPPLFGAAYVSHSHSLSLSLSVRRFFIVYLTNGTGVSQKLLCNNGAYRAAVAAPFYDIAHSSAPPSHIRTPRFHTVFQAATYSICVLAHSSANCILFSDNCIARETRVVPAAFGLLKYRFEMTPSIEHR